MRALETYNQSRADKEIFLDPVNAQLLRILADFQKALLTLDLHVTVSTERSLAKLADVSTEKKIQICSYFKNWTLWILESGEELPIEDVERNCLQKALDHYGLEADKEFWKSIEKDQIIEIYGRDMVQLYRSLSFFRITGYSLLDISVFEWYVLWDRPSKAIEETMNDAQKVINAWIAVKPFEISNQLIREVYDTRTTDDVFVPRAILAKFVNMGSLVGKDDHDNAPKGFICTSTAEIVARGEEAKNIQFL